MWAPDAYEGAPTPVTGFMAAGVKAAAFGAHGAPASAPRFASPRPGLRLHGLGERSWWSLAAVTMTLRQPGGAAPGQHQAHARVLVDRARRLHPRRRRRHGPGRRQRQAGGALLPPDLHLHDAGRVRRRRVDRQPQATSACSSTTGPASALAAPGVALAMTIFLLSLGGVPPTGGFFGKFYLFRAAMESPAALLAGRRRRPQQRGQHLLLPAHRRRDVLPRADAAARADRLGVSMRASRCCISAVAVVLLGIFPSTFVEWAGMIVK